MAGFRKRECTIDCIFDLVTFVDQEISCGNIADAVLIDVKKEFDEVSHLHVLLALSTLGARGRVLKCIANFLKDRKFVTKYFIYRVKRGPGGSRREGRAGMEILGYNLLHWLCFQLPWEDNLKDLEYVS